mmetsp:Transcript_13585/g.16498  ORF Transcript_13585/g.16498 Transcript_13585/m.16498 type:complete len:592 (-) Transcript_13585:174-1949(-)
MKSRLASSNLSSAPLKKRSKVIPTGAESINCGDDEQVAAAALTGLSSNNNVLSVNIANEELTKSGNMSESDLSSTSQESYVVPKPVHQPPIQANMVDHTYTNYSVVGEDILAHLDTSNDDDSDTETTEEDKRLREKALQQVKKIFGDISHTRKNSGGVIKPFPEKLMEVLDRGDMDAIITWLPHGRAFIVKHPQNLREVVLPRFFKQSKFMSFTRQLNLWGFKRITKGVDSGAYYHERFLRGRRRLSMLMRRQKIKGTGIKLTPNPECEPNFYKISEKSPLPAVVVDKNNLQPLPPLSSSINFASKPQKQSQESSSTFKDSASDRSNIDLFRLDRLRQMNLANNGRMMEQQEMSPSRVSSGMIPLLQQQRHSLASYGGDSYPMHNLDMQHQELRRPFQRLSAPTTQTDMDLVFKAIQNGAIEQRSSALEQQRRTSSMEQQHAMASAQQLLSQINGNSANSGGSVESLKQQLLGAVQSLEQSQSRQAIEQQHYPSSVHGGMRDSMGQSSLGGGGLSSLAGSQYPPMVCPNYLNQSGILPRQNLHETNPPHNTSIAALMAALDQTRQVAAAAQAQSSLLQQVASDLAQYNNQR